MAKTTTRGSGSFTGGLRGRTGRRLDAASFAPSCHGGNDKVPSVHAMTTAPLTAILVFPGFQLLDATGPVSTFEIAGRYRPGLVRQTLVAAAPGPVMSTAGVATLAVLI